MPPYPRLNSAQNHGKVNERLEEDQPVWFVVGWRRAKAARQQREKLRRRRLLDAAWRCIAQEGFRDLTV